MIPCFDWVDNRAAVFWRGFLLAPRARWSFLQAIKEPFIQTINHYDLLGESAAKQYAGFTTYLALNRQSVFSEDELISIFNNLPLGGLEAVVNLIATQQKNAKQPEDNWQVNTLMFYEKFWPKNKAKLNPHVSKMWMDIILNTGNKTPEAFEKLEPLITCCKKSNHHIFSLFQQSKVCGKHPAIALKLIKLLFSGEDSYLPNELQNCLNTMQQHQPNLKNQIETFKKKLRL